MPEATRQPSEPQPRHLTVYRYRLPLKQRFEHAAAARDVNEGVLVRLELADHTVGIGEGIPRPYVTGETIESAVEVIRGTYAARLVSADPLAEGPAEGSARGVWHNAAWCACETALLDARSRAARVSLAEYLGRLLGRPVSHRIGQRVGGVVGGGEPDAVLRRVRLMWMFGLRDFKLKVGLPQDRINLQVLSRRLGSKISQGKITLRVDANGVWSLEEAREAWQQMRPLGVSVVEQPLAKGAEADLPALRLEDGVPVMLDESLVDLAGAQALARVGAAHSWNIRLTKNGGLLASLRLSDLAAEHGIALMLGALVGESGILSAAARVFLQLVPSVRWVENSYGNFLVSDDLVRERTRFGYGGRLRRLTGPGLGVTLDEAAVERLAEKVLDVDLS